MWSATTVLLARHEDGWSEYLQFIMKSNSLANETRSSHEQQVKDLTTELLQLKADLDHLSMEANTAKAKLWVYENNQIETRKPKSK